MATRSAGTMLRDWRVRRRCSQMELANDVGVSPRHLSFVETGRSNPSPELLLTLAEHLEIPLRERNDLLLAAGFAPRFPQTSLDSSEMSHVRRTLERILATHDPYPGVVIDRHWNVVFGNDSAMRLIAGLPDHVVARPMNVFRLCLHPDGLASRTLNLKEWSNHLLRQLDRATALTGDTELERLVEEIATYPYVAALGDRRKWSTTEEPEILVPLRLDLGSSELSLFSTLTVFGTPQDVTLAELAIELYYPADEASEALLRNSAGVGPTRDVLSD